jgi:hypothetical protein
MKPPYELCKLRSERIYSGWQSSAQWVCRRSKAEAPYVLEVTGCLQLKSPPDPLLLGPNYDDLFCYAEKNCLLSLPNIDWRISSHFATIAVGYFKVQIVFARSYVF